MTEEQKMININKEELINKVKELYNDGYRLVQIGCTRLNVFEINYSFDKDYNFINLKLSLPLDTKQIPSISNIYWSAFIYENELYDLFGIEIKDIAVDYKGKFYRTKIKWPFSPVP